MLLPRRYSSDYGRRQVSAHCRENALYVQREAGLPRTGCCQSAGFVGCNVDDNGHDPVGIDGHKGGQTCHPWLRPRALGRNSNQTSDSGRDDPTPLMVMRAGFRCRLASVLDYALGSA